MHGLGDCANSFVDIFINPSKTSPFPVNTKVILLNAPQAPVTLNFGMVMSCWYDIKAIGHDVKDAYSKDDVKKNSAVIRDLMEKEINE